MQQQAPGMATNADAYIQDTDFDALSSRLSCFLKNYLPDDEPIIHLIPLIIHYKLLLVDSEMKRFAVFRRYNKQFFNLLPKNLTSTDQLNDVSLPSSVPFYVNLKSPLINRGTFLRTVSITNRITEFCKSHPSSQYSKIQVISLGAGNDTRPFYILPQFKNVNYFELDFTSTVLLKKLSILSSSKLSGLINLKNIPASELPKTIKEVLDFNPVLHTSNYHLVPIDLRDFKSDNSLKSFGELNDFIDVSVPTLLISECCICYLSKDDADNLIQFWGNNLENGEFLIYEPIGGDSNDTYGEVMIKNLSLRNIYMPTLMEYGTIDAQIKRFEKLLHAKSSDCTIECHDMNYIERNDNIKPNSKVTEQIDEFEELKLIYQHYCLLHAKWVH